MFRRPTLNVVSRCKSVGGLCVAATALLVGSGSLSAAQDPASGKVLNRSHITAAFAKKATTEVIVNLRSPVAAASRATLASPASAGARRRACHAAQQNVLDNVVGAGVEAKHRYENMAAFSAEVSEDALALLESLPDVASIEPVYILEPHLAQGVPLMGGSTYRSTYYGSGTAIAICDTGVDYTHPRLGGGGFPNSKVIGGYDTGDGDADPMPGGNAHGTSCAGIAAGDLGTVGDYIGGVAHGARIYALKISSGTGNTASSSAMVAAWDWCVTHWNDNTNYPIKVISTSFGGDRYFANCDASSPSMTTAANNAVALGITVVCSSGNDGYCDSMAWPACISSVISVGAVYDASFGTSIPCVDVNSCASKTASGSCSTGYYATDVTAADMVTSYANVASFLTLHAPSSRCYTLDIAGAAGYTGGDYYTSFGGTSAACPYTAGAAACLQSAALELMGRYLTAAEVEDLLTTYGDNVTDTKAAITKPRVNLAQAIASFDEGSLHFDPSTYSPAEDDVSVRVYVARTGGAIGAANVNYATTNGTATAGADYTTTTGTLSWADSDSGVKHFDVPILDDGDSEGGETFTVVLSGATGATLGSPSTAAVTIVDDEPPQTESFESGFGRWTNASGDDGDWTRHSGPTPSPNTGPDGTTNGTYYLYTEASQGQDPGSPDKTANLELDISFFGTPTPRITFFYHMFGTAMGTLNVDVYDGTWHSAVWSKSGQQHTSTSAPWTEAIVDLTDYGGSSNITLRLRGVTGKNSRSDMAIDLITVQSFAPVTKTLDIVSEYDVVSPSVGPHSYTEGTVVACSVTGTPVVVQTATGMVTKACTGWTGLGSVPPTGTGTSVSVTLNDDSTVTWQWVITHLVLSNQTVSVTNQYSALESITARDGYNIDASGNVDFEAGQVIRLLPGFHAASGSVFRAALQP